MNKKSTPRSAVGQEKGREVRAHFEKQISGNNLFGGRRIGLNVSVQNNRGMRERRRSCEG